MLGSDFNLGLADQPEPQIDAPSFELKKPSKRRLLLQLLKSDPTFQQLLGKQLKLQGVTNQPIMYDQPDEEGGF